MRLIDAEELGFEILENTSDQDEIANVIYGFVINAPTVDAVPVIRCKDCTYWEDCGETRGRCEATGAGTREDGYCAWGERKAEP